jgi:hypothetical protein
MKADYAKMTQEEFSDYLHTMVYEKGTDWLLSLPGVYEVVSEALNNEVLDRWVSYNPEKAYPSLVEKIEQLPREALVTLLEEEAGIQCYDCEPDELLRKALLVNVEDGTIGEELLG